MDSLPKGISYLPSLSPSFVPLLSPSLYSKRAWLKIEGKRADFLLSSISTSLPLSTSLFLVPLVFRSISIQTYHTYGLLWV